MPFFLHFLSSSGVNPLISCELAVQVLLDRELPASDFGYLEGVPDDIVLEALDELDLWDVWSTETVLSMTNLSAPPSVPTESFRVPTESFSLPDFSFLNMPFGDCVSVELTGVVGGIGGIESMLAVRSDEASDEGSEGGFGGSRIGGGPKSTFGVMGYSDSRVNMEGDGVSTSGGSSYSASQAEPVVVTEAIVSRDVRLRS